MQAKVIILVTDRGDDRHGEISVIDDPKKAARLIETIIEAGFEQERIRVFTGSELALQVTFRPVVTLASPEEAGMDSSQAGSEPKETEGGETDEEAGVDDAAAARKPALKFSSLFRTD